MEEPAAGIIRNPCSIMHAKIGGAKPIFVVLQHTKRTIHMSLAGNPNRESRSGNAHLDHMHPLVSAVSIARNSASTFANATGSMLSQDYRPLEYIVIDGASTNGTADIVGRYGARISKFVSEKDHGIYSAMNKHVAQRVLVPGIIYIAILVLCYRTLKRRVGMASEIADLLAISALCL
ncbi:MAG: glycosyltransferase [Steroidobacteraceae bacterium]